MGLNSAVAPFITKFPYNPPDDVCSRGAGWDPRGSVGKGHWDLS